MVNFSPFCKVVIIFGMLVIALRFYHDNDDSDLIARWHARFFNYPFTCYRPFYNSVYMTSNFNLKIVVQMFYKAILLLLFFIIFKRFDYVCKYLNYLIYFWWKFHQQE